MAEPAPEPEPRQADVVRFFHDSPPHVVIEIFRRLPARSILRLRAVCKGLREVTSYRPLLALLQLLQPPRPLLCFGHDGCPDRSIQLRDYCVEALDLRSATLSSVLRFTDNEYYEYADNADGTDAPPIYAFSKDQIRYDEEDDGLGHPRVKVHASIDGLLLVSFINIWYVCNPATRQWAGLPDYLIYVDVVGLYDHVSSGEYRVLYHVGKDDERVSTCYFILTVGTMRPRGIGCPISPAATEDVGLDIGLDPPSLYPPLQLGCNLHWPPQERQGYKVLVFDTEAEVFSWMRFPVRNANMQLLEMDRKLAMSVSRRNMGMLDLWRLDDYRNQIWNQIYHIRLPAALIEALQFQDWFPQVVSPEGDVLIECSNRLVLHCDRNGNLLHKFQFREETPWVRHALKETLLPHAIFEHKPGDIEPPFFLGL